MKILWLCSRTLARILRMQGKHTSVNASGGWLEGLSDQLIKDQNVKLTCCVLETSEKKHLKYGKADNFEYYIIPTTIKEYTDTSDKTPSYEHYIYEILSTTKPDVIHVFGTEFKHTWIMTEVCKRLGIIDKVVISIQGMVGIIAKHYFSGIENKWKYVCTLQEMIRRTTMLCDHKTYADRGVLEHLAIKNVKHVIGRTDWDECCSKKINQSINYYKCNETLRETFYSGEWSYHACKKHTIYISQASYSIKGLHMFLKALPDIIADYPNVQVYIGGNNRYGSNLIKGSGYFLYLQKLIKKSNLERHIHFLGPLSAEQVKEEMLKANVFLSSSSIENSPNSLGEAMLLGTPCISSDVGGVKNMLQPDIEGFIYPFEEYYMSSYYIKKIFSMQEQVEAMSKKAKEHAMKTHDPIKNNQDLMQIYLKIASK